MPRATPDTRLGDFCFSVAIRTLTLGAEFQGLRPARLGVGAGIVLDSRADDEYDECRLKARFLTGLNPGFDLFETMRARAASGVELLERHLERLGRSAERLGFSFDRESARSLVEALCRTLFLESASDRRIRLALAHDGRLSLTHAVLTDLPAPTAAAGGAAVTVRLTDRRLPDVQPLSGHKTTLRQHYDEGVREAERVGAFDSLFFTDDGRLVEGGRTSVFLQLDGRWWTPPVADGALPGVMRACLLEDPQWLAAERTLSRVDLDRADAIVVCNALRGPLRARLVEAGDKAIQPAQGALASG